jgi:hypothetical protein
MFYSNQTETAAKLKAKLDEGHRVVVLKSEMQTGKTGVIECLLLDEYNDTKKALITTGLASLELYTQSSQRLKEAGLVEKLSELVKGYNAEKMIAEKRIDLLIVDESHYGIGNDSRLHVLFKCLKKFPNLQIVFVSATPFEHSLLSNYPVVTMDLPENYFGITEMLNNPNFEDVKDWESDSDNSIYLESLEANDDDADIRKKFQFEFEQVLEDFVNNHTFGLGIIRVKTIDEGALVKEAIKNSYNNKISPLLAYSGYHNESDGQIEEIIKQAKFDSKDRRVLFITVGGLTAGFDFSNTKERIRFIVEQDRKAVSSAVQGLPGRICGYHNNHNIKVVASRDSLAIYSEWARGRMNDISLKTNLASKGYQAGTHIKITQKTTKAYNKGISFKGKYEDHRNFFKTLPEKYQVEGLESALNMAIQSYLISKDNGKIFKLRGEFPINGDNVKFNSQSYTNYKKNPSKFIQLVEDANNGEFNFSRNFTNRSNKGRQGYYDNINYGLLFDKDEFIFIIKSDKVNESTVTNTRHNVSKYVIE